jgi:hypothetical protein
MSCINIDYFRQNVFAHVFFITVTPNFLYYSTNTFQQIIAFKLLKNKM